MACPACRSPGTVYDPETGEECCGSCGMVVGRAEESRGVRADDRHAPTLPGAGSTVVATPTPESPACAGATSCAASETRRDISRPSA